MIDPARPVGVSQAGSASGEFGLHLEDLDWLERLRQACPPLPLAGLGPFERMEEIGQGSQGVVFKARQTRTGQVVALKRLGAGVFATSAQRARLQRELEAMQSLRHPGIVGVFGLEWIDSQPTLAMEWIDGLALDRWSLRLPARDRVLVLLRLLVDLCEAVHHAHLRGVIHRDLKPSNVLVDADGRPHVLDFGLAKLAESRSRDARLTRVDEFVGTPAYAAPEQLSGRAESIDVRTDVYALGAIAYELLSGRPPFERGGDVSALFEAIRTTEPDPPSLSAASVGRDLDAVVLKALSKAPSDRYQSVDSLAADLRRCIDGDAVEARRGSRVYALRKQLLRHWPALALVVLTISSLLGITLWLATLYTRQAEVLKQVREARDREEQARYEAQDVQSVLQQFLLATADISRGGDAASRRELLEQAAASAAWRLAQRPTARATAFDAIGRTFQAMALFDSAERCLREALRIREDLYGRGHLVVAETLLHLADILEDDSRYASASPLLERAFEIRAAALGREHPLTVDCLQHMANVLQAGQSFAEAEQLYRHVLELRIRELGPRHPAVAETLSGLGYALYNQRRYAETEEMFRRSLELNEQATELDEREVAGRRIDLGKVLEAQGDLDGAEPLFRSALESYRRLLGNRHDDVAWAAHRLGGLLVERGALAEAEPLIREGLQTYSEVLGPDSLYVGYTSVTLATLLMRTGRLPEAAMVLNSAEQILCPLPPEHADRQRLDDAYSELEMWRLGGEQVPPAP